MPGGLQTAEEFDELARAFHRFSRECRGSSPLYELLATGIGDQPQVLCILDAADARQRRPNLLFAAVHDLLLRGTSHPLSAYYPSVGGTRAPDGRAVEAFVDFCRGHQKEITVLVRSRTTQTNEVRRAGLLFPALVEVARQVAGSPLGLVDVGASAGLNLLANRYRYRYGDRAPVGEESPVVLDCRLLPGRPLPDLSFPLKVAHRVGIDLYPLDPGDPEDARWLRACIWPEHTDRFQLLEAALALASEDPPKVYRGEAVETLPDVADQIPAEIPVCVFHCATLAYFPEKDRDAFFHVLETIASRRPLWWISLEGPFVPPFDRLDQEHDLAPPNGVHFLLGLTEWTDGRRSDALLARGEPHGRWIQWLA